MLPFATHTGTVKRHRKTGVGDQSAPTEVLATNVRMSVQPVRSDDPSLFDEGAPAGARYYLFTDFLSVPALLNEGDQITDNTGRIFTVYRVEEHGAPMQHLKCSAVIVRKLTRVAA